MMRSVQRPASRVSRMSSTLQFSANSGGYILVMMLLQFLLLLVSRPFVTAATAPNTPVTTNTLSFGLINGGSAFFAPVQEGWNQACQELSVANCWFHQPTGDYDTVQDCADTVNAIVQDWMNQGLQGLALKPACGSDYYARRIPEWQAQGIVVVTLDSSHPAAAAYIGTDQEFLGRTMARLLRQLRPEGGTYAMVARKAGRDTAFMQELERYNHLDDRAHWYEVTGNYTLAENVRSSSAVAPTGGFLGVMQRAALLNPTAMIMFKQSPMRHENYTSFVRQHAHRDITYIGTDGADYQLAYLHRRQVDGLVGQLPYEFGSQSAQALWDIWTTGQPSSPVISTNIVAYNLIPLELPQLNVNQNLLHHWRYVGYVCFGIVVLSVAICWLWTHWHRSQVVVRAAQPLFLYMIATGVLIMSCALVPLSFDDGGSDSSLEQQQQVASTNRTWSVGVCMSIPWLAFTGFTVTFAALFSKTWRINRIFQAQTQFTRFHVSAQDVLLPFCFMLTANFLILSLWTVLDPLTYVRQEHDGTDYWNRVISTYGSCRSENNAAAYLVPLAVLNFSLVAIAGWQALIARDIQSEFAETKYIGLAVASLLQGFLTGIPVVLLVRDEPEAYYLIMTFMIFLLSMVLLWIIFGPKMLMQRQYSRKSPEEQLKMLGRSIKRQQQQMLNSSIKRGFEQPASSDQPYDNSSGDRPYGSSGGDANHNGQYGYRSSHLDALADEYLTEDEQRQDGKSQPPRHTAVVANRGGVVSELTQAPADSSPCSAEPIAHSEKTVDGDNDNEEPPLDDTGSNSVTTLSEETTTPKEATAEEAPAPPVVEQMMMSHDEFHLPTESSMLRDDSTAGRSTLIHEF